VYGRLRFTPVGDGAGGGTKFVGFCTERPDLVIVFKDVVISSLLSVSPSSWSSRFLLPPRPPPRPRPRGRPPRLPRPDEGVAFGEFVAALPSLPPLPAAAKLARFTPLLPRGLPPLPRGLGATGVVTASVPAMPIEVSLAACPCAGKVAATLSTGCAFAWVGGGSFCCGAEASLLGGFGCSCSCIRSKPICSCSDEFGALEPANSASVVEGGALELPGRCSNGVSSFGCATATSASGESSITAAQGQIGTLTPAKCSK
jgi:hypothetical protein